MVNGKTPRWSCPLCGATPILVRRQGWRETYDGYLPIGPFGMFGARGRFRREPATVWSYRCPTGHVRTDPCDSPVTAFNQWKELCDANVDPF